MDKSMNSDMQMILIQSTLALKAQKITIEMMSVDPEDEDADKKMNYYLGQLEIICSVISVIDPEKGEELTNVLKAYSEEV